MDQGERFKRKPSPKDSANIISVLSFFYVWKIFVKGFRKDLEEEDLYDVPEKLKSEEGAERLENEWFKERAQKRKCTLLRVIWHCYGTKFLIFGFCQLVMDLVYGLTFPHLIGKLVGYFSKDEKDAAARQEAYIYASAIVLIQLVNIYIFSNYNLWVSEFTFKVKASFCSMMYRKYLKLHPSALTEFPTGKIVTLMTKDIQPIETFMYDGCSLLTSLLVASVMTGVLYMRIGFAVFVGIAILLVISPLQIYIGKIAGNMRISSCKRSDVRLQSVQEVLSAIKIIKMYTWEPFFLKKISTARKAEIRKLRLINLLKALAICIGMLMSSLSFYLLIITYIKYGTDITAENIFYTVQMYDYIKYFISSSVPYCVFNIAEFAASITRIGGLLDAEEIESSKPQADVEDSTKIILRKFDFNCNIKPNIVLTNVSTMLKDNVIIKNASCTMPRGLNVVTGPLGCGKSSLLKIILKEYPVIEGDMVIQGTISYASQDPWIFPATIRQNILFGAEYDEKRYSEVIRVCDLQYDYDLLAKGDLTTAEDNGTNLSKGQQARINLARAVYRKSDIYLLDDCLSSLDAKVQAYIFENCIEQFLKEKVCVLITHNMKLTKKADQLILMQEGRIHSVTKPDDDNHKNEILRTIKKENNEMTVRQLDIKNDVLFEYMNGEIVKGKLDITKSKLAHESNLYREDKKQGRVNFSNYKKYLGFGGGIFVTLFILGVYFASQTSFSYVEKLLSEWVNTQGNITKLMTGNQTNSSSYSDAVAEGEQRLNLYFLVLMLAYGLMIFKAGCFYFYISRISINIHKLVIEKVIYATMEFFDNTYIGNILNRFSRDMNIIDEELPFIFSGCLSLVCSAIGVVGLVSSVDSWLLIPSAIVFVLCLLMRRIYIPTGRSLKRLDCSSRSPVIGHLGASIEGLSTIRAHGHQDIVTKEFDRHQDLYISACHLSVATESAFGIALGLLSQLYISSILIHLLVNSNAQAGDAGLALTQALSLNGILKWFVRQWAYLENQMTSVERVLEYASAKQEDKKGGIINDWPKDGTLEYKNVSLTYEKTGETVLRNVNFKINPREKIGIIGRTGAGKSSVISTLFKLYNVDGQIFIDDTDSSTLSPGFFRSKISIIPQDPVLFKDTVRNNIDPFRRLADEELWKILEIINLKDDIHALDTEISNTVTQFSAGQKQLFCLARALVSRNKILIMDEATANMDDKMSSLMNTIIKEQFSSCTILTIAHKLDSLLNSDKILVMDKGEAIEFASPSKLMENKHCLLYQMAEL